MSLGTLIAGAIKQRANIDNDCYFHFALWPMLLSMLPSQSLLVQPQDLVDVATLAVPAPANVLTPSHEANTRLGLVTKAGYAWCWEQTPDNPALAAGTAPTQGMLQANTEAEAIERLREHFPAAGRFQWISRWSFTLPAGLKTAY